MSRTAESGLQRAVGRGAVASDLVELLAGQHGVEPPTAEKVLWLSRLLQGVMQSDLGGDFALMGGSAIVFLYRDMYRISTDLDLDFVGDRKLGRRGQAEVKARIERDRRTLTDIAGGLGMELSGRGGRQPRFVQYQATYPSLFRRKDAVELDISYRFGHSVLGTVWRPWPVRIAADSPWKVNTLREEELYAGKALAMFDVKERLDFPGRIGLFTKRKIRHLFDVYLLARKVLDQNGRIDTRIFRDLFVLFGMTRVRNFEYFRGNSIGAYTKADVDAELLPVVPRGGSVATVDEMKWEVRKFLDQYVLNYTDREYQFMEDFRSGRFRPEHLFPRATAARLRECQYYREILDAAAPLRKA